MPRPPPQSPPCREKHSPLAILTNLLVPTQQSMAISSWMVEHYRFTGFFEDKFEVDAEALFKSMGLAPDSINRKPKERITECQLKEKNHTILIRVSPGRFDFRWNYPARIEPKSEGIPFRERVPDSLPIFQKRITQLLPIAPVLSRVAFGCMCHEPAVSKQSSYESLKKWLPALQIDPVNSTDLVYRINRPRLADFEGEHMLLNRIMSWCGVTFQVTEVRGNQEISLNPRFSARLELDINTAANANLRAIGAERLIPISVKLVELAMEILDSGDKP